MNPSYCRLCLKSDCWNSPVSIFDNPSLPNKLNDLLKIQLNPLDSLPKVICHLCLAKVTFLIEFHTQVSASNNLLNSLVGEKDATTPAKESQQDDGILHNPVRKLSVSTSSTSKAKFIPQQVAEVKPATPKGNNVTSQVPQPGIQEEQKTNKKKSIKKSSNGEMNMKLLNCPKCRYHTRNASLYEAHIKEKFECPECRSSFCSERGVRIHYNYKHKKNSIRQDNIDNDNKDVSVGEKDDNCDKDNDSENNDNSENNHSDEAVVSDREDHRSDSKNDAVYLWCQSCNKVYMNEADFVKHNEEYHNFPRNDETKSLASNVNRSELSNSIQQPSKSNVKKRRRPPALRKKDLDKSDSEEVSSSKVMKKNYDFTCWKCKGVYKNKEDLFIHPCIHPDLQSSSKNTQGKNSADSLNNDDDDDDVEVVNQKSMKKQVPQIISDDEDYDNKKDDQAFDEEDVIQFMKRQLNSKKNKSRTIYTSDESDTENCNENVNNKKKDVSDYASDENDVSSSVEDDKELPVNDSDTLLFSEPVKELPESSHKLGSLKRCNECSETFPSMKELFHHKRLHRS